MKAFKKFLLPVALVGVMAFVAACGNNNNDDDEPPVTDGGTVVQTPGDGSATGTTPDPVEPAGDPLAAMNATLALYPQEHRNNDPILQRGEAGNIIRIGVPSESPMAGLLGSTVIGTTAIDTNMALLSGSSWSIFSSNEGRAWGNTGIARHTVNPAGMYIDITLVRDDVLWHDGVQLTLDDLVFAYEVIAHPDYPQTLGIRWTAPVQAVRGIHEFRAGEADHISGLVLSEDKMNLRIYFDDLPPTHTHFGAWSTPMPRHHFEGVAVADMPDSPQMRQNVIGWGPFYVYNIVPGEAVHMRAFDDFFDGAPLLDGVTKEIISTNMIPEAMANGHFDTIFGGFPLSQYPYYNHLTNITFLGSLMGNYTFFGFRLGLFDFDNSTNVTHPQNDPNKPITDVNFRRAMAYAIDQDLINETIFSGFRFAATSVITPFHPMYLDASLPGFPFDPDRANQLLDEAGFEWLPGEEFRRNQAGDPFTLIFAFNEGGDNHIIAQVVMQDWADVGIDVQLLDGRMQEFVSMTDLLQGDNDNGEVDIYFGAWVPGFNPNPAGRWGPHSQSNRTRFVHPDITRVFENLDSPQAWDADFRLANYHELQYLINYHVPMILNNWRIDLVPVNNRLSWQVTGVSDDVNRWGAQFPWHQVGVTRSAPYVH
ncbi:MAG: ABC transporter substrate-binding protein [Defluviitaleaceae bacterium]|nr:ABC transporter substrate-binding protein [Defluviitaleaceae bacterium]